MEGTRVGLGCRFGKLEEGYHLNPHCPVLFGGPTLYSIHQLPPEFSALLLQNPCPLSQTFCIHVMRRGLQGEREPLCNQGVEMSISALVLPPNH